MQRCFAKAISMHGIGLYIYAGEDLPLSVADLAERLADQMRGAKTDAQLEELRPAISEFVEDNPETRDGMLEAYRIRKTQLAGDKKPIGGVQGLKDRMKAKEPEKNG
jgi:hypothetical protein